MVGGGGLNRAIVLGRWRTQPPETCLQSMSKPHVLLTSVTVRLGGPDPVREEGGRIFFCWASAPPTSGQRLVCVCRWRGEVGGGGSSRTGGDRCHPGTLPDLPSSPSLLRGWDSRRGLGQRRGHDYGPLPSPDPSTYQLSRISFQAVGVPGSPLH